MVGTGIREAQVMDLLHEVKDPEVPVLDIVELGIVRGVELADGEVVVRLTPTYSGCPAMQVIEEQVVETLGRHGFDRVTVKRVFNPAWTTDWIAEPAKEKLRAYGIAPPGRAAEVELVTLGRPTRSIRLYQQNRLTLLQAALDLRVIEIRHPYLHLAPLGRFTNSHIDNLLISFAFEDRGNRDTERIIRVIDRDG